VKTEADSTPERCPTATTVRVEGSAPTAISARVAGVLGETIRAYLEAHDLRATGEPDGRGLDHEQLTIPGLCGLHPHEHRRCNTQRPDYARTGSHPKTNAVQEKRILATLDPSLGRITDADHRADTIAAVLAAEAQQPPEPAHVAAARRALRELPVELDRVLDAIRVGMDPQLATATTRKIQAELAAADAILSAWDAKHDRHEPLTADDIATALDHAGSLTALLAESERGGGI
jgi:hypothetical protein